MKNLNTRILVILAVIGASIFFAFPIEKRINLGLDLKGGMHLILKVETEKLDEKAKTDAVPRAIEILRNRIDSLGAGETVIQRQGENEILVQLPGITDREKAISLIGKVAQLEFRIVDENPTRLQQAIETKTAPAGFILKYVKKEDNEPVLLEDKVALSGETVSDAYVNFDSTGFGQPQISIKFNAQGAKQFGELTKNNVNRRLAIVLDGEVLSAPNINEPILGGDAQVTGQFTFQEASVLALALRSGALPAPMRIEEERTVGPLLGKDSINDGVSATLLGAALIFGFMLIYYLYAGILADIALALNFLLILGIMGFVNMTLPEAKMTLTLPGIAGIILTLGMAVDANILINERIREEIENGRTLAAAINNGFNRALSAIVDSNLTTFIAAFMLFQFGSGPIKGFALTLTIGIISSVFTAVFVSRTLFNLSHTKGIIKKLPMLRLFGHTKIDFIAPRWIFFTLSSILLISSAVIFVQKKDSAYGIDFVGGQIQEFRFKDPVSADSVRTALSTAGLENAIIQQFDQFPTNVMVRTGSESYDSVIAALKNSFTDNPFETLRIEKVGPIVGKQLRKSATLAIIFALAAILIYVGFRFKHFDFAAAGVIALLHDILATIGVLLFLGREIDLLVITALLTIAGYSINDTIVIYDRVRENMGKLGKLSLAELINLSVNQTLGRTILTTSATMLAVLSLYFKGGEVLNTFSLALIIGFISGTYSTVFIASPLVLFWNKRLKKIS